MSTEEKNFKFKKSLNNPEIQSTIEDSQVIKNSETIKKRLHAKEVLINKYHLSEMEAEEKLNEAERKALAKKSNGKNFKGINHKNQRNIDNIQNIRKLELKKHNEKGMSVDDVIIPQYVLDYLCHPRVAVCAAPDAGVLRSGTGPGGCLDFLDPPSHCHLFT